MGKIQTMFSAPDGRVVAVNRKRLAEYPYFLLTNQPNNKVTVAARSPSQPISMTLGPDGPGQITALSAKRTDADMRVFLLLTDGRMQRGLMNSACHIDTIFGNGQLPYHLPEALYLPEGRALQAILTDFSGSANDVYLTAITQRYTAEQADISLKAARERMKRREYLTTPYWYTPNAGKIALTANGTATVAIDIASAHHFQLFQMSVVSDGNFSINIVDNSRGESLIQAPQGKNYEIPSFLLFGTANLPFRFHEPRIFSAGQKIILKLTDLSGAANTVWPTFGGRAIATKMWS